jgi:DNA recombination protein RmuC
MELSYLSLFTAFLAAGALLAAVWVGARVGTLLRRHDDLPAMIIHVLDEKHVSMLKDLSAGLDHLADRLSATQTEAAERLRATVALELKQTRDALLVLQMSQTEELSASRETLVQKMGALAHDVHLRQEALRSDMQARQEDLRGGMQLKQEELRSGIQFKQEELRAALQLKQEELRSALQVMQEALRAELLGSVLERLAEQGRAEQELMQTSLRNMSQHLSTAIETLTRTTDGRLEQITGKVTERLEEGFKKTNETFSNVMARLATIDEAQRKIDGLTTTVVTLQELLGDKRSRGAFGEVQLEALIRNLLPPNAFHFQYTLSTGNRADCVLMLPEPTGMVAVDSKFPLENYHRMLESGVSENDRAQAQRQFRIDLRSHIEDIGQKYIIPGETSDGAVMFVPAEAVFAEIHAYHGEIVDFAMQRRVWIVSPTTMMAVLNTARAVLKDVETRRQVHIIKDELTKLGKEFGRFDQRMKKLADHIRQAHEDAEEVRVTSDKITRRFSQIERVELEHLDSVARLEQTLSEVEPPLREHG